MLRTHTCGELNKKDVKKKVTLSGWVNSRRDHGGVVFIDLRDRYGLTQVVFNPSVKCFDEASKLRREDCIQVIGDVVSRTDALINKNLSTGEIEVVVNTLNVINKSDVPPLEVDDRVAINEDVRLKYRYLDLRRPSMQKNFAFRHKVAHTVRAYFDSHNFLEIETPLLIASTPEGARDYVVPSRVNPGKFYALPQSPQIYKQMLMVGGFDRYYQMAKCLRDEDLRVDRQPEFTQIDIEMSFVEQKDVLEILEGMTKDVFKKCLNVDLPKFPVFTYEESMEKYGNDKPDLRFGMELIDVTSIAHKSDFSVFKDAASVRCLPCPKDMSRGDIDKLIEWVKSEGGKGLAWMRVAGDKLESSIVKYFNSDVQKELMKKTQIDGGILFFAADSKYKALELLGKVRSKLGKDLGLLSNEFKFCFVVDFPMFEFVDDKWEFKHNPFAMPKRSHLDFMEKRPGDVYADLYDLVLNGIELGSGSIRITQPALQERVFKIVGMSMEEAKSKFGFMMEAYRYGGPIHGGFAFGFDRLVALMNGVSDIREFIAFPKNKSAECPMDGCPSALSEKDLKVLRLKVEGVKK